MTLTDLTYEAAAQATRASAKAYLDGLDHAVGAQRQLVAGTPFEALSELLAAHAGVTRQVVESSLDLAGRAPSTTVEAARAAEATTARLEKGTARAATKATRRTARAATKAASTTRRAAAEVTAAPATPKPPIAGYDELTAEQLIAKLPELSQSDLVAVQRHERAQGSRATVLERVEALQGVEPAPGYDELTVDDAQKLVAGGTPELATRVRDYERRHKSRAGVLEATGRKIDAA